MKRNSSLLKNRLSGRWLSAFSALAPCLNLAITNLGSSVPCPLSGGTDGFRLFNDANETGGGVKHLEGVYPEGISLLMWVNDWSFVKVFDELEAFLGGSYINDSAIITKVIIKPKPKDDSSLRWWLNNLWACGLPLNDTLSFPAKIYFLRRNISMAASASKDIRFHPKLAYKTKEGKTLGTSGAILTLIRNNKGEPVAINRLYITSDGYKANFGYRKVLINQEALVKRAKGVQRSPKKMTPAVVSKVKGRQIRLFQPKNGFIGISEGLETALAVYQAKEFPVWSCISTTMLQSFEPPKGIHTVINFVDKDRNKAGEKSAKILEDRLSTLGIKLINLLPPTKLLDSDKKGVDWADQLERDIKGFNLLDKALYVNQP